MIRNMTKHELSFYLPGGTVQVIPADPDGPARVATKIAHLGKTEGLSLVRTVFGEIEGLPNATTGVTVIVSRSVRRALDASGRERLDVVVPDDLIRNSFGDVIGARGLSL